MLAAKYPFQGLKDFQPLVISLQANRYQIMMATDSLLTPIFDSAINF
jgi:hypothetical protein